MSEETQVQVEQEVVEAPGMPAEPETLVDGPGNTAEAEDVINDVLNSGESEDAFSALMGDAKDNVPGTKSPEVPSQEIEMPVEASPKGEDESFQYWQSQADKRTKELEEVKSRYQDLEDIAPIARYIRENPQVLNSVESSLSVNKPQETLRQENSQELAKRPDKPSKPADYDPIEATNDTESASFKYREAMETFRDDMMDHYEAREKNREVEIQRRQDQIAQQNYMENVRSQLSNVYGFKTAEAESFIEDMSRPESLSLENLVTVWKLKNKPNEQQIKSPQKVRQMQAQKEKLAVKQPVGVAPSQGQVARGVEDQLMDAMVADYKSKNPW
tara:strand:- start:7165 stop:8154 length:990 start_codon:yes stop_codon:yes gene_type:complete